VLIPIRTTQFKRDIKLAEKRRKPMLKIKAIITKLINEESLDPKNRNHKLSGNYRDHWECHIEPDWLLIYRLTLTEVIFERTGSHSDLFKK
jgi:mRNA interferase YafQ